MPRLVPVSGPEPFGGNNKTYMNVRHLNSKFLHFVAFTPRLNGLLLPRWFYM